MGAADVASLGTGTLMDALWIGLGFGAAMFGIFSGVGVLEYLRAKAVVLLDQAGYTVEGRL